MMSLRAVHAGTGYQYLLRSVATHDADPEGKSLSDYYAAKGTPPGRWIGSGLAGLLSETATAGAVVGEVQMAALYGEGLHPDTDQMMAEGKPLGACKLGRAYPLYSGDVPVLAAISAAEKSFLTAEGRRPNSDERNQLAESVARPFFSDEFGYEHASGKDVIAWVNRERDKVRQAVAGFDFTFSPVKSVSVLWALSDEHTASKVAALHHQAVAEALRWAEDNAIYTRVGAGGIEQVRTRGIVAAEFTHFDTRGGDPDLHSHVLIANKVQGPDGRWRTLDSRTIHQMHQAISARYDAVLHDLLSRRMGLDFEAHYPHPDKAPIWEIKGIDRRLIDVFSSRRALARPVYEQLVAEYVEKNGRQPTQRAAYALWQKAILDTRDAKKPAQSLDEHRAAWRRVAEQTVGLDAVLSVVRDVTERATVDAQRKVFDAESHARQVAGVLEQERGQLVAVRHQDAGDPAQQRAALGQRRPGRALLPLGDDRVAADGGDGKQRVDALADVAQVDAGREARAPLLGEHHEPAEARPGDRDRAGHHDDQRAPAGRQHRGAHILEARRDEQPSRRTKAGNQTDGGQVLHDPLSIPSKGFVGHETESRFLPINHRVARVRQGKLQL